MGSLEEPIIADEINHANTVHLNGISTESAVLHRSLHHRPLYVTSAKGNYLHLSNGQKILDATGGAAVACLGSGNIRYGPTLPSQMRS
jgi:adenosylmethionine-8-amino-7-oxononanoate aminotransferase